MGTFGAEIPFIDHCRIEALDFADGRGRLRVALGPEHLNNLGIAHGGLIATLLDVAMGATARSVIGRPVLTLDMQVAFLAPGRGTLTAEGRIVRAGRSIVFCEADVRDAGGELVARSTGTMKATRERADESA